MRLICHVGLGKTGTTYLQNKLLPALHEQGVLNYIDVRQEINDLFAPSGKIFPNNLSLNAFTSKLKGGLVEDRVNFISHESLVGWDPAIWEHNARLCKKILPDFSEILISIREPRSLFISMYSQMLKEGARNLNIEHYLLGGERYKVLKNALGDLVSKRHIDVDNFSYERLSSLWKSLGFASVRLIDYKVFFEEYKLVNVLNMDEPIQASFFEMALGGRDSINKGLTEFGYKYIKSKDHLLELYRVSKGEPLFRSILQLEGRFFGFHHVKSPFFRENAEFIEFCKFHNLMGIKSGPSYLQIAPTLFFADQISTVNYASAVRELAYLLSRDNFRFMLEDFQYLLPSLNDSFKILILGYFGDKALEPWEPVRGIDYGLSYRKNVEFYEFLRVA